MSQTDYSSKNNSNNKKTIKTSLYVVATALLLGVSYLIANIAFAPQPKLGIQSDLAQNASQEQEAEKTALAARAPINVATESFLIPQSGVTFTPTREQAVRFQAQDLTIQAIDSRVTGTAATCTITYRQYPNGTGSNSNASFVSTGLTGANATYNPTTGCRATLPAAAQTFYLYEFNIVINDSTGANNSGFRYESSQSYFFIFGAISSTNTF